MAGRTKAAKPASKGSLVTAESIYSVQELAENAEKVFGAGVRAECAAAALRMENKDSATLAEARKIVEAFMKKEVR